VSMTFGRITLPAYTKLTLGRNERGNLDRVRGWLRDDTLAETKSTAYRVGGARWRPDRYHRQHRHRHQRVSIMWMMCPSPPRPTKALYRVRACFSSMPG
jgi:hypothetical protein